MTTYLTLDQDDADTLDDLTAMESFTITWNEKPPRWTANVGQFHGHGDTLRAAIRAALHTMLMSCQESQL
jgi:hypothetical protein